MFLPKLEFDALPVHVKAEQKGNGKPLICKEEGDTSRSSCLARSGIKSARKMAVHNQLKLYELSPFVRLGADDGRDPSVKRTICKNCSTFLVPGFTSRVRNRRVYPHFDSSQTGSS